MMLHAGGFKIKVLHFPVPCSDHHCAVSQSPLDGKCPETSSLVSCSNFSACASTHNSEYLQPDLVVPCCLQNRGPDRLGSFFYAHNLNHGPWMWTLNPEYLFMYNIGNEDPYFNSDPNKEEEGKSQN